MHVQTVGQYTSTLHHACTDRGPIYWYIAPCMYRPWANILAHCTMHVQTVGQYTSTLHHACTDRGPIYWYIAPCMYRPWANILAHCTMHVQTVGQYTGTLHHACTARGPIYWCFVYQALHTVYLILRMVSHFCWCTARGI